MELFEVRKSAFEDLSEFNNHISDPDKCDIPGDLHVVVGLSQFDKEDLTDILSSYGFEIREYGAIKKIRKSYTKTSEETNETTEYTAEFYFHHHDYDNSEGGVVLFYTNQRKTKEIEHTIKEILEESYGLYYLHIGTNLFKLVRDEIKKREDVPEIVEFVADRSKQTDRTARIRDEISNRTIRYFGEDGWETLYEMEENYGVSPRYLVFNVPNKAEFKIARDGIFSLHKGNLKPLFEYIQFCIQKSLSRKQAFDGSDFEMVSTTPSLSIPTSEPAVIVLGKEMEYGEAERLNERMDNADYFVVDSFKQRGSLHLISKIYDEQRDNTFRIKVSDKELRVFPEDEEGDLGTFLRFHEFVQNHVDPEAEAVPN